jgi:hypothetical protein
MSIEVMKQSLEALEVANSCVDGYYIPTGKTQLPEVESAITALRQAIEQAEQPQPDGRKLQRMRQEAWRMTQEQWKDDPELCFALGYEAGYNDAVAPRAEPRASESGAGFESLPASPNAEQAQPLMNEQIMDLCAAEREACAKLLDEMAEQDKLSNYYAVAARAIRARGQDPMPLFADWNKDWK